MDLMEGLPGTIILRNGICVKVTNKDGLYHVIGISRNLKKIIEEDNGLSCSSTPLFDKDHKELINTDNGFIVIDDDVDEINMATTNVYLAFPGIDGQGNPYVRTLLHEDKTVKSIDLLCNFPANFDEDGHCIQTGCFYVVKREYTLEGRIIRDENGISVDAEGNVINVLSKEYTNFKYWKEEGIIIGENSNGSKDIISRNGEIQLEGIRDIYLNCTIKVDCYSTIQNYTVLYMTDSKIENRVFIIHNETGKVLSELDFEYSDIVHSIIDKFSKQGNNKDAPKEKKKEE